MTAVIAQLVLAFACLIVLAIVLGWTWCMGVFAAAPRRARQAGAHRTTLTATTARDIPSPRKLPGRPGAAGVPRVIRGEVEP
jgi:hypothetical protein